MKGVSQAKSPVPRSTDKHRLHKQLQKRLLGARLGDSTPINIQQFREEGDRLAKGKNTIGPSVWEGIAVMKHHALRHIANAGDLNDTLQ